MYALRTGLLFAALLTAVPAGAAEVNVIAAGAVRGIVGGMIDDYARETGHKFNLTVGPTGMLRDALTSGKRTDLVIVRPGCDGEIGLRAAGEPDTIEIGLQFHEISTPGVGQEPCGDSKLGPSCSRTRA